MRRLVLALTLLLPGCALFDLSAPLPSGPAAYGEADGMAVLTYTRGQAVETASPPIRLYVVNPDLGTVHLTSYTLSYLDSAGKPLHGLDQPETALDQVASHDAPVELKLPVLSDKVKAYGATIVGTSSITTLDCSVDIKGRDASGNAFETQFNEAIRLN